MKLIEVELTSPAPQIPRPSVGRQWVLVRLHGDPMGMLRLEDRPYEPRDVTNLALRELGAEIASHLAGDALESGTVDRLDDHFRSIPQECPRQKLLNPLPITVAVCTRNRAASLAPCLDALAALRYPADRLELLVIDNAPDNDLTEQAVRLHSSRIRYVCEPRPGLDWARNRAILEARGDIVAFTDDDVRVDAGWAHAIARAFEREPDAMAMTGLVVPEELDTEAQIFFEQYGGFSRGTKPQYARTDVLGGESAAASHAGTGRFGTGANMAFRRSVFASVGLFDPALDVGTVTNGGGDLEMFFRIIKAGHLLVYEPGAIVRHVHRRDRGALATQLENNGIGYYAYLTRSVCAHPDERWRFVRHGIWWFTSWNVRRLLASLVRPDLFPRDLILRELTGSFKGPRRYRTALKNAADVERRFGPQIPVKREGAGL